MSEEKSNFPLVSKVRLKERDAEGEFGPFIVSNSSHACIKKIIDAFENSKEVKLGYATVQKDKGLVEPTMKRKTLYLTGESARDHLKNKKFSEYELVTDASPDEIKKILASNETGFEECKPHTKDLEILQKYKKLPALDDNCFYASRWDNSGAEIEITAICKGMKIHLSTFGMHSKNRMLNAKKAHFATNLEQDASTRDLTINALYIKLKDSDGENGELFDPRGGMHDLKAGVVRLIEKATKAFENNPYLPLLLCNICARFTEDGKIPESMLKSFPEKLNLAGNIVKRILSSAFENIDVPLEKYLHNLKNSGLMRTIFSNLKIQNLCESNVCHVLPHNKLIILAYLLLDNDPYEVQKILQSQGYSRSDVESIVFLIRMGRMIKNDVKNPNLINDLFSKPVAINKSRVKEFLEVMGTPKAFRELIDQKFEYHA
jgi:hypothetical protein